MFYQVYPPSFCLADPDGRLGRLAPPHTSPGLARLAGGSGDLEGVRRRLAYLAWLGVDAIWLCPFYKSPMADFGYDVSDHCDVDPLFGTLEDFDRLVDDAHRLGIRVVLDLVPNHTSVEHPWFADARSSRDSAHRSWYVWRDPDPDEPARPPNNWVRAFGEGPAWTFDQATQQWYLHLFLPEQPDLDWANPEVEEAMLDVMRFWLERGADGFRIDVTQGLGKDPALPDAPAEQAGIPWSEQNDDERTHPILRRVRRFLDSFANEPVSVGEVFLLRTETVARYYGDGDELHLAFNFPPMFCGFEASCFRARVEEVERFLTPRNAWPTWVLSSHDRPRHRTRYGGSERRARAAAVVLLAMRGTPFLCWGEELGQEDAEVPPEAMLDPGGRDGCRALMAWDSGDLHGWALPEGHKPLFPFPPEAAVRNVETEAGDPGSVLSLYRELIALRRSDEVLRLGHSRLLEAPPDLLAVERFAEDGRRILVGVNFAPSELAWPVGGATVLVSSAGEGHLCGPAEGYGGRLGPEEAVVLRVEPTAVA